MPIWIVKPLPEYEALVPADFVEADSEADALIFCSQNFPPEDWPFLIAEQMVAGPALRNYARMNREYKTDKKPWDDDLLIAHMSAIDEWLDQFDVPSIPDLL